MKTLNLETKEKKYNIYIGKNSLIKVRENMKNYDKILILTNETIFSIYKNTIEKQIVQEDKNIFIYSIQDGEKYKNIETITKILTFMLKNNFTRKSLIISLGGGVICDMGGFSASIFMRGIEFIQVPTSLLSMVDASIGGKTGINHELGKNIIGTFKQPEAVFIDINFLETLPNKEFLSGMGEIIKHGIIIDNEDNGNYLNYLKNNHREILELKEEFLIKMIEKSCIIKKNIVELDEKEKGIRAFLNLGHTYSHTLETISNYDGISHGEGVSKGIIFQFLIGEKLGFINTDYRKNIENIFQNFNINCKPVYIPNEKLISIMRHDKKNSYDKINFIIKKKKNIEIINIHEKIIKEVNKNLKKNDKYIKAVIDIGTNSCRLLICQVLENKNNEIEIIKKLHKETNITQLGKFVDDKKNISELGMSKVIEIIKHYKKISGNFEAKSITGFATSVTREANNKDIFLQKIYDETNIKINYISGKTEAELTFFGAINKFEENILLFDIGGGSTEIILGNKNQIQFLKSFKVGAIRETKKFFKNDNYDNIEECILSLKERMKEIENLKNKNFTLVGVAGTVTTNVSVKEKMINYNSKKVHGYLLQKKDLIKNLETFLSLKLEERKKLSGLQPERAESVIAGTIITLTILNLIEKNEIFISEWDNLEGFIKRGKNEI